MFLIGMAASALIIGWLLVDFSPLRLIRVVQGAALAGILLNLIALWQQERPRPMSQAERAAPRPLFRDAWADLLAGGRAGRLLVVVTPTMCHPHYNFVHLVFSAAFKNTL